MVELELTDVVAAVIELNDSLTRFTPLPTHSLREFYDLRGLLIFRTCSIVQRLFAQRTRLAPAISTARHIALNLLRRDELGAGRLEAVRFVLCPELDGLGSEALALVFGEDGADQVEGDFLAAAAWWEETLVCCRCPMEVRDTIVAARVFARELECVRLSCVG